MDTRSLTRLAADPRVRQLLMSLAGQAGGRADGGANMAILLDNLSSAGLGAYVSSWVGTGDNTPVSPKLLTAALGTDQVHRAAAAAGMTDRQAADRLAKVLPQVVDQASPTGEVPAPADFQQFFARLLGDAPR